VSAALFGSASTSLEARFIALNERTIRPRTSAVGSARAASTRLGMLSIPAISFEGRTNTTP
jgi:hypothetical protein